MRNKVDIIAVAKQAGVSISTVSRTMNHPNLVKPATRKRIDDAIRTLGYIRNRAAQAMHGKRSGTIGLIVPTIDHTIFAEVIQVFSDTIADFGFSLILTTHGYDLQKEYQLLRKLLEHRVDGVALIGFDHLDETMGLLESQKIPVVSLWNYDAGAHLPCVGATNFQAGKMAAQHLWDLGHRHVGFVFSPIAGNDRAAARMQGAGSVFAAPAFQVETEYSITAAKAKCQQALADHRGITALLCGNDVIGTGAIYAAQKLGLDVPGDLSIMGIGDFKGSADIEPPLSTVRLPAREIGERAGTLLCRLVAEEPVDETHIECDLRLLPRATSVVVTG